jgi:hypothetical protein
MILGKIVKASFITSFILTWGGALMKIMHYRGANALMIAGFVATLVFIISAITEIRKSNRIGASEKTMWTIGLIFLNGLSGLIYILFARKRIVLVERSHRTKWPS